MKKTIGIYLLATAMITAASLGISGCGKPADSLSDGSKRLELLNVSYDPTREFYSQYNERFCEYWRENHGEEIQVVQSHGGSNPCSCP